MAIIGIDLGTTNSLACVWRDGKAELVPNSLGEYLTPSAVYADEHQVLWTGAVAREHMCIRPERCAASFKRHMGTDKRIFLGSMGFTPQELSSMVLKQLKEDAEQYLGCKVEEAVISVPAYFNDEQRFATKEAGQMAGLRVERLVNEPSAAALACRSESGEEDSSFLVVDLGGGTLDVSVVECFEQVIEIQAVAGDNRLGGDDFDHRIAEHFCREHGLVFELLSPGDQAALLKKAEQCKRSLTSSPAGMIEFSGDQGTMGMFLTGEQLTELLAPLLVRLEKVLRQALKDAGKTMDDIDQVVLVGGSCKMPLVRQFIARTLEREPYLCGRPDEIVALGAGIYAGIKSRQAEIRDVILTDICPFTLGVGIVDYDDPDDLIMSPVIERNSVLPVSRMREYVTTMDNQRQVAFRIFQGESIHCSQNEYMGTVELAVPPAPKGREAALVRLTYDINGILEVEAMNRLGQRAGKVIMSRKVRMSEEELERRTAELEAIKRSPREEAANQLVISRGERLYAEALGNDREVISQLLRWFSQVLGEGSPAAMAAARKKAMETLDYIERKLDGDV